MQLSKTLSALALLGAAIPSTFALSIKDDQVKLGVGIRIQTRATIADADNAAGDEYSYQRGVTGANDPIDFAVRRARLMMKIGYGENWKGGFEMTADKVDLADNKSGRSVDIYTAWMERVFKTDMLEHAVHFGLDKPYNNPSDAAVSSSKFLFPNENAAGSLLAPRGVGIGYRLNHSMFDVAVDLQNNAVVHSGVATEDEGLFYGARVEASFSPEWFTTKRADSYLGKEGHAAVLGVSYGINNDAQVGANSVTTSAFGVDILFWMNNITAYAEFRSQTIATDIVAGGSLDDVKANVFVIQGAYAFPLENGCVIEPALRFQKIDLNTDNDNETAPIGANADSGKSGTQVDLGVNYYLDGHNSKIQVAYQIWKAEDGDAKANIIRIQHAFNF